MKKALLFVMLISSISIKAQTYDEIQLVGTWNVENITGTLPMRLTGFESLILEEAKIEWDEYDWDWVPGIIKGITENGRGKHSSGPKDEYLLDFFISNGNKLHLIVNDEYSLRFIIEELTEKSLILKTYKGDGIVMLTKQTTSGVRALSKDQFSDTSIYNLQGVKADNVQKTAVYINNGQKIILK